MYGNNWVDEVINMVQDAIDSFNLMGIINPIPDQTMYYEEVATFDLNDMFEHPTGEPVTVTLQENTNPDVVEADVTNNILTLTAQNIFGNSTITLLGSAGTLTREYDFDVWVTNPSDRYILIYDMDETPTGNILQPIIQNHYNTGDALIVTNLISYPFANVDAIFVMLGICPNNYVLTETEADLLASYLDTGGNVYMEGGDTWFYDIQTSVHPYFNIIAITDGISDLSVVDGTDFLSGMTWSYSGENSWIDHLYPYPPAVTIFSNTECGYDCGIAYDEGIYKTVGTSFEITGLGGANSLDDAVSGIMDFFFEGNGIENENYIPIFSTKLGRNYPNPFNPVTNITYSIKETDRVTLEVYNLRGQLVKTLVNKIIETGNYSLTWDGTDNSNKSVSSGVYFYKMKAGIFQQTKRMILMK